MKVAIPEFSLRGLVNMSFPTVLMLAVHLKRLESQNDLAFPDPLKHDRITALPGRLQEYIERGGFLTEHYC